MSKPLNELTIADLIDLIENPPAKPGHNLARTIADARPHHAALKLLDPAESAAHWYQKARLAHALLNVPEIELRIAAGLPKRATRQRFSKRLRDLAALKGVVVPRWGRNAFLLKKAPRAAKSVQRDA
jgi:hypothetical protein